MNTNKEFPKYTKNQSKGDGGQDTFSETFTCFCLVNPCQRDVGIDFLCILREEGEYIKGKLFGVQLKSTEMKINDSELSFPIRIKKASTINFWLEQVYPVFLVVYEIPSKTFFWCYPKDQFPEGTLSNDDNTTIQVNVSTRFSRDIEKIPPKLLKIIKDNSFPEKFSNLQKKYEELLDYKEQLGEKYRREEEDWGDIMLEDWKIEKHNQQ